ncbi:hypothetical protein C8R47DRAFT_532925 [Mycena vitilis]|nr:hypothetical protein C8R47DRAFT_532925 [Mycena vitilis]
MKLAGIFGCVLRFLCGCTSLSVLLHTRRDSLQSGSASSSLRLTLSQPGSKGSYILVFSRESNLWLGLFLIQRFKEVYCRKYRQAFYHWSKHAGLTRHTIAESSQPASESSRAWAQSDSGGRWLTGVKKFKSG